MKKEEHHNCRDEETTASHIEKYGLSVIVVEATDYLPSFAYSIGLWKKHGHPEIISFGFTPETLHAIINNAADIVKAGEKIEVTKGYDNIFEKGNAQFVMVDPLNIGDYFGYAIDFYGTRDFPAMQLVWQDRQGKFPWENGFEEEFTYKQPLLDRNANFKFREPKNLATFTTRQWLELKKPILRVVHEDDGDWQFLTGDQMPEDIKIVALEQLVLRDNTLNDVFNLGYGEAADRGFIGGKWKRSKVDSEEDENQD